VASFVQEYSGGLAVSIVGHALIVLMFGFNLISMPFKEMPPVQLAIEATLIDMGAVRKKQEDEKRRQLELERQKQAVDAERRKKAESRKREQEQQQLAEQKRRQDVEQKRIAEQKRKAEAEQKRAAEQKRKKEQARIAEQKRKEDAARLAEQQRKEAERLRQQEIQRQLQSEIAAEEKRLAAIASGKLQQYIAAISSRVNRNWVRPASAIPGIECDVHVTQIPGGEIINVRVGSCNGDAAVVRSIEAAVYRASPLPPPPDPSLFERNLRFRFKPEE
jgi:colicin import membrane protein